MYPDIKLNNTMQKFDAVCFYPNDYFCPVDYKTKKLIQTENTSTIHWFAGSWVPKPKFCDKVKRSFKNVLRRLIGEKRYNKIKNKYVVKSNE